MLVVTNGKDKTDKAFRARNLGVARIVYQWAYKAARVARELERLFGDGYRERAAAVAADVRKEGGAEAAAAAIDEVFA